MSTGLAGRGAAPITALLLMGVSGCGKTTVGEALARELGWRFVDADDHHPPANVEKMRAGRPLDDTDRAPWLARLNALLRHSAARGEPVVLACSALKARYRAQLADRLPGLRIAHLSGSQALIEARLADRQHRYMPASLLASQFAALEAPQDAWGVEISDAPAALVAALAARVRAEGG
jgi:gluconokinase